MNKRAWSLAFCFCCLCSVVIWRFPEHSVMSSVILQTFLCLVPKMQEIYVFNYCTQNSGYANPKMGSFCMNRNQYTFPLFFWGILALFYCYIVFCLLFLVFDFIRDPTTHTEGLISRFPFASQEVALLSHSKKKRGNFETTITLHVSLHSDAELNMAWTSLCSFYESRRDLILAIKLTVCTGLSHTLTASVNLSDILTSTASPF